MPNNILLVDKRVQDYEILVSAANADLCNVIVFDYDTDTISSIKERIMGAVNNQAQALCVGLVQHNYHLPFFKMVSSIALSPVAQVEKYDSGLLGWKEFSDFIIWCKTELSVQYFDMMACALYSDPNWRYIIDKLTEQTGVTIRASTDDTGAESVGGNWFLESHTGVDLKTVYFTDQVDAYQGALYFYSYSVRNYTTKSVSPGSVVTWGSASSGGDSSSVNVSSDDVVAVYSNWYAFSALKTNGTVAVWGDAYYAGDSGVTSALTNAIAIYGGGEIFAAINSDGGVITWGAYSSSTLDNVDAVCTNTIDVAVLKSDGDVLSWGIYPDTGITSGAVVRIYATHTAFAAIKTDGSVSAWGNATRGGNASEVSSSLTSGVVSIYATERAFAALKSDGSVVTWGDTLNGGDSSSVSSNLVNVVAIFSTGNAFAALKTNGSVVTWGGSFGGTSTSVSSSISSGVSVIAATRHAFAALKTNGTVVTWGDSTNGGNSSSVAGNLTSVVSIYATYVAFAALKSNGTVVTWGGSSGGGNSSSVSSSLTGIVAIRGSNYAFAALTAGGTIVTWGDAGYGGDSSAVSGSLTGVVSIYSMVDAFAALTTTATTFSLSGSHYTDMDRYDILRKKDNRRRVNLTTLNNNTFSLSQTRDLKILNPSISSGTTLNIIVPDFVSSSYTIEATATIPANSGSVVIACEEGEPVTISGTTYVNYGSYVYTRDSNSNYTKLSTATINGVSYTDVYGGDGINSSGIVFIQANPVENTLSTSTFVVPSAKSYGDASFNITTRPTSNSSSDITYSSSNTSVATVDASGNWITLVGIGDVSFNASQAAIPSQYTSGSITSNTLTVSLGTPTLSTSTFSVASSKVYGDASFAITTRPTSNSSGAITYTSNNPAVATIDASGNWITLVDVGDASFNATQAAVPNQFTSASITSNTLTVSKVTPILTFSNIPTTKNVTDAAFTVTASSPSGGAVTYTSSNPSLATVDSNSGLVTLKSAGTVTITAYQAESGIYAPANAASTMSITAAGTALAGQTVSPGTSFAGVNLSGASLDGSTLSGVSFSGANLSNVNFSGAVITETNFTNANISGATNLPTFSTTQKLQLLSNINNVAVGAIQIGTPLTGADINAMLSSPVTELETATFTLKVPATLDASSNKVVTITVDDVSNNTSVYIPLNANESVKINGVVFTFDGTNVRDASNSIRTYLTILGVPFKVYAGSIIGLNILSALNKISITSEKTGLYDVISELFTLKP